MSVELDQAIATLQQGDVAAAITQLEKICQAAPDDYEAQLYLGTAYGRANRHQDAVHALTRAVTLRPSDPQARYNLGVAYEHAGWTKEALEVLQQAVMLKPDYTQAQEALQRLKGAAPTDSGPATVAQGQSVQPYQPLPAQQPVSKPASPVSQPAAPFNPQQPISYTAQQPNNNPTIALVLGVLSIFCCGFLSGIPAIIMGSMELKAIKEGRSPQSGHGLAMAGLVTGVIGVLWTCVGSIAWVVLMMLASHTS